MDDETMRGPTSDDASDALDPDDGAVSGAPGPLAEVEPILERALAAADEGAWERMAEELRDALPRHPDDPYVLCWLGMAERELGMEGIAAERFRRALESDSRDPVLLATAGNALAAFDDPVAEGALRTAALIAPHLPQTRWMYGAWLAREGMFDDALAEFDAALELDPDDPVIRTERGVAFALAGRMEEAAAAFGSALELDPDDGWAAALLGLAYLETGDDESAARELDMAAHLRPEDLDAHLLAALALGAIGEEDRAFEMLERARMIAYDEEQGGGDAHLVAEVEEHLDEGAEEAGRILRRGMAPSSFRERLMQRP